MGFLTGRTNGDGQPADRASRRIIARHESERQAEKPQRQKAKALRNGRMRVSGPDDE